MPIFDNLRGLVPLPNNRSTKKDTSVDNSLQNPTEGVLSSEVPIPLPRNNPFNIDTSNTLIDQVFTEINDVFQYIQLPVPESITEIYKLTQEIENVIQNPVDTFRREISKTLYESLHPKEEYFIPVDSSGSYPKNKDTSSIKKIEKKVDSQGNILNEEGYIVDKPSGEYLSRMTESEGPLENELKLNRNFKGIESVKDLTLRSVDLWDIKINAFEYNGQPNNWVPPLKQDETSLVNFPNFYEKLIPSRTPIISDYMPITSYNLDLKTLTTKQITLFGGSSIQIPDVIRYSSQLTFQLVDDENRRWRRWFQTYSENLYSERNNSVAPYKNSSLVITLAQYRRDHKVVSYSKYICTLANYQMISMGAETSSVDVLDIELSIVGKIESPESYEYLQIV